MAYPTSLLVGQRCSQAEGGGRLSGSALRSWSTDEHVPTKGGRGRLLTLKSQSVASARREKRDTSEIED